MLKDRLNGKFGEGNRPNKDSRYMIFQSTDQTRGRKTGASGCFSFHGGGFVLGFYELDGPYCQKLANLAGCMVINIDYCLAPEFKFPKPVHASYETICEILKEKDRYGIDSEKGVRMRT